MKICDLTQFYSPVSGGVRRYIEQKVAYLRRNSPGDEHILVIPGGETRQHGDSRTRTYEIASPLVSRTSRYRILFRLHLVEEILETEKPDIIEVGDPYQVAWKAVASGRALSMPVVGFYHSHFPEAYIRSAAKYFGRVAIEIAEDACRRYIRTLYNHLERTLVPSPALGKLLSDWGVDNVVNIDLGVDTEVFHPAEPSIEIRRDLGIPPDEILLLYVGRLAAEKNVCRLFEAFEALRQRSSRKYHLLAVGDGAKRSELLRLKEATGAVTWLSYCADAVRLARIYRAADLFVHPGLCETFGLVAIESQACGTPVVGIRGSYMDRIIFTNQLHWAETNTTDALAGAIEAIAQTDIRVEGRLASVQVLARYSWNSVFDRLFSIYRNVIAAYKN